MEFFKKILGNIVRETRLTVKDYIRLQAILSLVTGVFMVLSLNYMGLRNYIIVGVLLALVEFLPVVDSKLVFIPWILVKLIQKKFQLALGLLIIYVLNLLIRLILSYRITGEILPFQGILRYVLNVLEVDKNSPEQ